MTEPEFVSFYDTYIKDVPSEIVNSFSGKQVLLKQMKSGYEAHYMKIMKGSTMIGLTCFNIDPTMQTEFRAYLRHFSVKNLDDIKEAVKAVSYYIFDNLNSDTIRTDIYHYKESPEDTILKTS